MLWRKSEQGNGDENEGVGGGSGDRLIRGGLLEEVMCKLSPGGSELCRCLGESTLSLCLCVSLPPPGPGVASPKFFQISQDPLVSANSISSYTLETSLTLISPSLDNRLRR